MSALNVEYFLQTILSFLHLYANSKMTAGESSSKPDQLPPSPVKTNRICINLRINLRQKWGGYVHHVARRRRPRACDTDFIVYPTVTMGGLLNFQTT